MTTNAAPPVLGRYTKPQVARWRRRLAMAVLALIAIAYGFLFALGTTYLLVQLATPLVAVAVLVIALLPDTGKALVLMQERLLFAFVIGLLCWPDYIALALPGMPLSKSPADDDNAAARRASAALRAGRSPSYCMRNCAAGRNGTGGANGSCAC